MRLGFFAEFDCNECCLSPINVKRESYKTMKYIVNSLKYVAAIALLALPVGCASEQQNKQDLAVAAGFKLITPKDANQASILKSLPDDKVTPINYKGKTLYVLPDKGNNQAYVGRAQEYQAYQQLRLAQHLNNQNLEAAQLNREAASWDAWGGWGVGWGGWGGWGGAGWGWR